MAARKKEDMPNMIETFKEFKDTKKIDRATLVSVLEESFRSVIAKIFDPTRTSTSSSTPTRATLRYTATASSWPTAR